MKKQHLLLMLPAAISLLLWFSLSMAADGIKERMAARLPEIVTLKDQGIIGEDNKGYVQFVGAVREKAGVVQAENADRVQVYQAIAQQQGTTVDLVGQRRSQQIKDIAQPGHWLQDDKGSWYKK